MEKFRYWFISNVYRQINLFYWILHLLHLLERSKRETKKKIAEIKKSAQKKKRVSRHVNSLLAPLESRTKTHAGCKKKTREWILTSINWLRYGFSLEESVRRWFKALRELRMTCFSCIKISHSIYWHNWFVF